MNSSTFLLLLRLGLSLALVFGLMWVAIRMMRGRDGMLRRQGADNLEVLERKALTKNSSIAIVRIADQTMAIGITDQQVTLLTPHGLQGIDVRQNSIDVRADAVALPESVLSGSVLPESVLPEMTLPTAVTSVPAQRGGGSFLDTLRDMTVRHEERVDR